MTEHLRIVPADQASADDLDAVFARGDPARCRCQWFKIRYAEWRATPADELARRLREQTQCGHPGAASTSGLVAFLDGEPAGWCAVQPRTAYPRLLTAKVPWAGRQEERTDERVWAVTCFVTRPAYRRRGVGRGTVRRHRAHVHRRRVHPGEPAVGTTGDDADHHRGLNEFHRPAGT